MRSKLVGVLLVGLIGAMAFSGVARGQEPRQDVLASLLTEVRALRGAIEQMASSSARVQLAMGRLQIQEQRVNTLSRQLTEVRASLSKAERERTQDEARLADLEDVLPGTSDPGERRALAQEVAQMKIVLAGGIGSLQKLRADEAELANVVAGEQGRWVEINQQLEALDQAFRRP
jgi:chromosome segregation ATPase